MLLAAIGLVLGALLGAWVARRRKGVVADMVQYAVVYGLVFALAGLFLSIVILRAGG